MPSEDQLRYLRAVSVMAAMRDDPFGSFAYWPQAMIGRLMDIAKGVPGSAQQTLQGKFKSLLFRMGALLVLVVVVPVVVVLVTSGDKDPPPWVMSAIALIVGAYLSWMLWRLNSMVVRATQATEQEHRLAPLAPAPGDDELYARLTRLYPYLTALAFILFAGVAIFFYIAFSK